MTQQDHARHGNDTTTHRKISAVAHTVLPASMNARVGDNAQRARSAQQDGMGTARGCCASDEKVTPPTSVLFLGVRRGRVKVPKSRANSAAGAANRTLVLRTTRSRTAGSKCFGAPPPKQPQERGAELLWSGSLKSHDDVCSQDSWKLQRRKNFLRPTACAQSPRVPARRA